MYFYGYEQWLNVARLLKGRFINDSHVQGCSAYMVEQFVNGKIEREWKEEFGAHLI
jgi:hypothetical protein